MSDIFVPEAVRDLLEANLLEERDLVQSIGLSEIVAAAERPGRYTCRCLVPVRRAFDPETAELRRLDLELERRESGGWQVVSIDGL